MPTTEIDLIKAFWRLSIGKMILTIPLLSSVLFAYLFFEESAKVTVYQEKLEKIQADCNKRTESIYDYFLKKTEMQIEELRTQKEK